MRALSRRLLLAASTLSVSRAAFAAAEEPFPVQIDVIYERFNILRPTHPSPRVRADWTVVSARVSPEWRLVGGWFWIPRTGNPEIEQLEETYLEHDNGRRLVRAGRIRSRFGFNDWSEQWYTPIVLLPLMRNVTLNQDGLSLTRFDAGIELQGNEPGWSYAIAAIDPKTGKEQVGFNDSDYVSGRIQKTVGDVMVGLNALQKVGGDNRENTRILGLDARWGGPQWHLRAEAVQGSRDGADPKGLYFDAFYRPPGLHRTQLGVRLEQVELPGAKGKSRLATIGVRQILMPELVLTLNYSQGSAIAPAKPMRGWTAQLMTAFRFRP